MARQRIWHQRRAPKPTKTRRRTVGFGAVARDPFVSRVPRLNPPYELRPRQAHRLVAIGFARRIEQRHDGGRESGVLGERRLDNAAALLLDCGARVAILLDGAVALPQDGVA